MPQTDMQIYQPGGGKNKIRKSTFPKVFHSFWLKGGHFVFTSPTVGPYQRCSWSGLWLRFMTPLFPSTSPINWTSSHYWLVICSWTPCFSWLSSTQSGSRPGLLSVLYGKCNYSNYCWEVALAWGHGATLSWTGCELLLDAIRMNLHKSFLITVWFRSLPVSLIDQLKE